MAEAKKRGDLGKAKSKSSAKHKKSGKKVHEIHLRRAESGELIAKHKHHSAPGEPPMEDEEHIVPEGGMQEHVDQHMPPQQEEAPPQAAPAPQAGAMMGAM